MHKNITKKELAKKLAERLNIPHVQAYKAIQETFCIVEEELKAQNRVIISKFGTFELKSRKARVGRNPRTNETIHIKARKVPFLRFSKKLIDSISKTVRE